jgi:hypothetical protein
MKVLVFTSAYSKRPYMLRQNIFSASNQTYKDFTHSVNITLHADLQNKDLSPLYDDIVHDRLIVNYSDNEKYCFSHFNNMNTIRFVPGYESYDLFIKMDDDDIYKKDYVQNVVSFFENNPNIDITSSKIKYQLNGDNLTTRGEDIFYDNLGGNPGESTYRMPITFAFNKKALDCIINLTHNDVNGHDDLMWRTAWENHGLIHTEMENHDHLIWNVHGNNASVSGFLQK